MEYKDRLLGCLWGAALGDALGAPYEFRYGRMPYKDQITNESTSLSLGQVTDDTEMMLALAQSLRENDKYVRESAIRAYCDWATSDVPDIGANTRSLFLHPKGHLDQVKAYEQSYKLFVSDQPEEKWSQSNGCLMRVMATALLPREQAAWLQDCMLSNPHSICQEAVDFYMCMLHSCLDGTFQFSFVPKFDCNNQAMTEAIKREKRDLSKSRGWVVHGLYCAIRCYTTGFNFVDGMRWVIGEHLDSDTDTNACIAGAILGAKLGYKRMMECPITRENVRLIKECKSNRPDKYHPKHIDEIVEHFTSKNVIN